MTLHPIAHYPMGPKLKSWLGIHKEAEQLSDQNRDEFLNYVLKHGEDNELATEDELTAIVDELVSMDHPFVALKLIDMNPQIWRRSDFRGVLAEGIAAMITQEYPRAELCFSLAHELVPEEPAPYSNMAEILIEDQRFDEALNWVESGLDTNPNHFRLWELFLALSRRNMPTDAGLASIVFKKANDLSSWAGASLAAEIDPEANASTKVVILAPFYHSGERDEEFLIEYTGALGASSEMDQIPPIIWTADRLSTQPLPWRLYMHAAQAYFALGKHTDFLEVANKISALRGVPPDALAYLRNHVNEAKQELAETEGSSSHLVN
jgi:hypothetical protein